MSLTAPQVMQPPLGLRVKVDLDDDDLTDKGSSAPSPTSGEKEELATNIFIAGLPSSWGPNKLRDLLSRYGTVVSVRVVPQRHYGFAQFKAHAAAAAAIEALHHTTLSPQSRTLLHASFAMHSEGSEEKPNERVFIRGLPPFATLADLRMLFAPFGTIVDSSIITGTTGHCKGSGFVRFDAVEAATLSIAELNETDRTFLEPLTGRPFTQPLTVKYCETQEMRRARQTKNKERLMSQDPTPKAANTPVTTPASVVSPTAAGTPGSVLAMPMMQGGMAISPSGNTTMLLPKAAPSPMGFVPSLPVSYPGACSPPNISGAVPGHIAGSTMPGPTMQGPMPGPMPGPTMPGFPGPSVLLAPPLQPGGPMQAMPPMGVLPGAAPRQCLVLQTPLPRFPWAGDVFFSSPQLTEDVVLRLCSQIGEAEMLVPMQGGFAVRMRNASDGVELAQRLNGSTFAGQALNCAIIKM